MGNQQFTLNSTELTGAGWLNVHNSNTATIQQDYNIVDNAEQESSHLKPLPEITFAAEMTGCNSKT